MKRSEILYPVTLIPLDLMALLAAFALSYYLRDELIFLPQDFGSLAGRLQYTGSSLVITFSQYLRYLVVIIPVMLVIFAITGLYAIRSNASWPRRFMQIFIGVSMGEFFILLLFLLKKNFFLPRATVLYSWVLATLFVLIVRLIARLVQKILYSRNLGSINVALIGDNQAAKVLAKRLFYSPYSAYRLSAQIKKPDLENLTNLIQENNLDELIVASQDIRTEDMVALRNFCLEHHISFSFVPDLLTSLTSSFDIRQIGNLPVVEVRPTPLDGWGRVIKRLFDITMSLLMIIILSPVFILLAVVLEIVTPGPLIYKHLRVGKNKKNIFVWKFRSMIWEYCTGPNGHPQGDNNFKKLLSESPQLSAEWESGFKLKNDPRVTKFGNFIRKTSLDELPQLFNVLGGSLSLVGPRPIIHEEIKKYGEKARILFSVKPGVTGLWQISGRNDVSYEERISLDSRYIEHWNLWWDIVILFKTFLAVISRRRGGAY